LDAEALEMRGVVEALLFVGDDPLSTSRIAALINRTSGEVTGVLKELRDEYVADDRGFQLREVAGGWKLYTHPAHYAVVEELVLSWDTRRLSQAALEALAVIAYQQPVTRQGVNAVRGVNSEGVISSLVEKGLVKEVGRDVNQGNAILYATTRAFLEKFGLKDLTELPPLEEFAPDERTATAIQERLHAASSPLTPDDDTPADDAAESGDAAPEEYFIGAEEEEEPEDVDEID
jgi:segregation and condensation protein B